MTLERKKWPDQPHYRHRGSVLGRDEHGVWVAVPPQPFYLGERIAFHGKFWVAQLVPDDQPWWAAFFPPGDGAFDLYVDIGTVPEWSGTHAAMFDLDLDVLRYRDGRGAAIVDEDEFEAHAVEFGYPAELVTLAERAAAEVLARVGSAAAPFGPESLPWLEAVRQLAARHSPA